jgi:HK97 family phage major capsid protein
MDKRALTEERVKLHEDNKALLDKAAAEKRNLTAEEQAEFDKRDARGVEIRKAIENAEKVEAEERALAESRGRKTETGIEVTAAIPSADLALRGWLLEPYAPHLVTAEMRAAAQHYGIRIDGKGFDMRALSVGTTTAGGNSVPNEMMKAFMEIEKWYGRVQNVATVVNTTTGATLPWPTVDDTANTGRLLTEGTGATTTTDPSFGVVNLSSYKMSSDAVIVSLELLQDSSVNMSQYLGAALGTRIGRIKNTYFTTGSGSSQPGGVQVKASLGKTAAATNAITLDEVIDTYHSVDVAYRSDPSFAFMMHDTVAAYVRKLKDSQNRYLWEVSVQAGQPDRLFGVPVIINNDMDSAFSTNKRLVLAGAFSRYVVRIAGGVTIARSDDVYFLNHQSVFLGVQRVDGNLIDTTAVKYLRTA